MRRLWINEPAPRRSLKLRWKLYTVCRKILDVTSRKAAERTLSRQKFERKPPKCGAKRCRLAGEACSDQRKLSNGDAVWLTGQRSSDSQQ